MRTNYRKDNMLAGAASVQLFGSQSDYRQVLARVQSRAQAEGIPVDQAFKLHMRERLLGQALMTGTCLSAIGVAMLGAAHDWSDFLVAPFAMVPLTLMFLVGAAHQRAHRNE